MVNEKCCLASPFSLLFLPHRALHQSLHPFLLTMQRYEKSPKPPNLSSTFFIQIYKLFPPHFPTPFSQSFSQSFSNLSPLIFAQNHSPTCGTLARVYTHRLVRIYVRTYASIRVIKKAWGESCKGHTLTVGWKV